MARNSSQSVFKERSKDLLKQAALVSYGIELPDTYCLMVLANKMSFKQAIKAFLCEDGGKNKPVH